ncbi:MAG: RsiV family protein [Muribaculaceae bacterium]|nr:RsiV family protein [Muribaculaceae bacterium]
MIELKKTGMAIAAFLMLASCSVKDGKTTSGGKDSEMAFESYEYDVIAEVTDADSIDNEGWRYCRASGYGVFPKKVGGNDISVLRDSLESLASVAFVSPDKIVPEFDGEMKLTSLDPDSTASCGSSYNMLSLSLATPRLLVWKSYAASYICAAAHGSYRTYYVNYRISDNRILGLSDVMRPGYEDTLKKMIHKKLQQDEVDLLVPIEEVGIPSEFQITTDGISFIYGLYEIAPYSSGEVAVNFAGYELEEILAPGMLSLIYGLPED